MGLEAPSIIVFEPKFVGHHLSFAREVSESHARAGFSVELHVPEQARRVEEGLQELAEVDQRVCVRYSIDSPLSSWREADAGRYGRRHCAGQEARELARIVDPDRCSHLVVPTADNLTWGAAIHPRARQVLARVPTVDLIVHICRQIYPPAGARERLLAGLDRLAIDLLPRNVRCLTGDPWVTRDRAEALSWLGRTLTYLPYPLPELPKLSREDARKQLGLPLELPLIGALGSSRKDLPLLVEAFARAWQRRRFGLVIVGRTVPPSFPDSIPRDRIVCRTDFLSSADFLKMFRALDALWCRYPRSIGLPGIFMQAVAAGLPALTSDVGCVGWLGGLTGNLPPVRSDPDEAAQALVDVLDRTADPAVFERVRAFSDRSRFDHVLREPLQREQTAADR